MGLVDDAKKADEELRAAVEAVVAADEREHFIAEVKELLLSFPSVREVKRIRNMFALTIVTDGVKTRALLDNHYAETREMSPDQRRERLLSVFGHLRWRSEARGEPLDWESARELLVPVLRPEVLDVHPDDVLPEMGTWTSEAQLVRRRFVPFLDVLAAVDLPASIMFVTVGVAKRWGVDVDAIMDATLARASVLADPKVELCDDTNGPLWRVASNDFHDSARLVVPDFLASFKDRVEGTPVAIVPERGTMMIGGDARPVMIRRLLAMAEREFTASSRRVSCALYSVDEQGGIVPYAPLAIGGVATEVRIAHEKFAELQYDLQKNALERAQEGAANADRNRDPERVFFSTYNPVRKGDVVSSVSTWTKGVNTYLPRTELVTLVTLNQEETAAESIITVPFEAVSDRLSQVPGLRPARFRTGAFPDEAELRALESEVRRS